MNDRDQLIKRIKAAEQRLGLRLVMSRGSSHTKIYRGKRLICVLSATPSDARGLKNAKAHLRREGIL